MGGIVVRDFCFQRNFTAREASGSQGCLACWIRLICQLDEVIQGLGNLMSKESFR